MSKAMWKIRLEKHAELAKTTRFSVYERATILALVYDDPEYEAAMKKQSRRVDVELNLLVSDTCLTFSELYQLYKAYPKKDQWEKISLVEMRDKLHAKVNAEYKSKGKRKSKAKSGLMVEEQHLRSTATLNEVRDLKGKIKDLETENSYLKERVKDAQETIAALRDAVKALEHRMPIESK